MAYGLVNDTTLQGMADGLRNKNIAPSTVTEKYEDEKLTLITPNVVNEETAEYSGGFVNYEVTINIPEATQLEFRLIKVNAPNVGATGVGAIYLGDISNYTIWSSMYETELFVKVVDTNYITVRFTDYSVTSDGEETYGAIVDVYALDADGNYISIPQSRDVPNKLTPEEMVDAINNAAEVPPSSAFTASGDCAYKFAGETWNWFVDMYGDKITFEDVTAVAYMFLNNYSLTEAKMGTVNLKNVSSFTNCFYQCRKLTTTPKFRGTIVWSTSTDFANFLDSCRSLRNIDEMFTDEMFEGYTQTAFNNGRYSVIKPIRFNYMYSLRKIPSWFYKQKQHADSTSYPTNSYGLYYTCFRDNYAMDELLNLPVVACAGTLTDNQFQYAFNNCYRAKRITFETNADGTPIVTQWKSQTIDLTTGVGHTNGNASAVYSWNSGITVDKQVTDDATYAALKEDPDWFTNDFRYGRFNHDSAVALINSLPDTSAYLATAGGTNTLKLPSALTGSLTDGGAINTLTEEEIAVATAKGWTVTF